MSELRKRIFGSSGTPDSTPNTSRDASPAPPGAENSDDYRLVSAKKLELLRDKVNNQKGRKRRNAWIFGLGGLFGVLIAGFFATPNGAMNNLVEMAGLSDLNLDSIMDVLPAGLIRDVQELQVSRLAWASFPDTKLMLTKVSILE